MKITDVTLVMRSRSLPNPLGPPTLELGVLSIVTDEGIVGETFVGTSPARPPVFLSIGCSGPAGNQCRATPRHGSIPMCPRTPRKRWRIAIKGFRHTSCTHPPTQRRVFQGEDVPLADDIAACAAIRAAVGDDYILMLDSAWAYNYAQALTVGQAIQDLGYYWYEDPLKADDIYGYVRLKERLHIPIVATEVTDGGVYALPQWLLQRATDALRGDTVIKGGITGLMKIAHLAEAFQMNCEVHDGYNALNNAAGLNVIMAIDNCEFFEIITIHAPDSYDLDHLNYGLAEPFNIDANGNIHAPTKPGLGFDVDWDLINSSVIARL